MSDRITAEPKARALRSLTLSACLLSTLSLSGLSFVGCSSGGGDRDESTGLGGSDAANANCSGACPAEILDEPEISRILQQGIAAAEQLGVKASFAVLDRVGNVLAVYQMSGATATTVIDGALGAVGGLEGVPVPATVAAISKAGTGAYLSSQGNAFSTRTASQIVQENFNPGEQNQPGGPLFGVQFSQLICGDVTVLNRELSSGVPTGSKPSAGGSVGPRPLPLGLSADPGGFPLYQNGDVVGGIGVEIDGRYSLDRSITDYDSGAVEEIVALAASRGFEAPSERVANNIIVGGKALRYSDVGEVPSPPTELPALDPSALVPVPLFSNGSIRAGVPFGSVASGVASTVRAGVAAMTLVGENGAERFPSQAGASLGGAELQPQEVEALLDSALRTAERSRAAIRRPLDSSVRVSVFVVDSNGTPIGFTRSQDAPVFGIDVSLQKARTALFFSSPDAGSVLSQIRAANGVGQFEDYSALAAAFTGPEFLSGAFAVTARAVGNLARPFYPDGINGNFSGPFSLPFPPALSATGRSWSPLNDGLQLDLIFQRLVQPLGVPVSPPPRIPDSCADERFGNRLRNGIQIFAGSVPLYRGSQLIGAIGVSGDGIDQDDMVAFLGASQKGLEFSGHGGLGDPAFGFNAPPEIRSDLVEPPALAGTRLRYVNCPEAPFIGSSEQNVCDGL